MNEARRPKIVCLSNIFDQHYHDVRGEKVERQLTTPFRRDLFQCLETASGREVILLSFPPKASERREGKWLAAVETKFATHRQWFCCNWDVPKLRIPLAWFFYARQALRHVRSGDLVVIDNYEFIYIVAARLVGVFRRVTFVLVYLDGKHLIDRSWARVLSGLAEWMGRGLFRSALLANPTLGKRLPDDMPKELVPGFIPTGTPREPVAPDQEVRFLYTGALDEPRGISLLLQALDHLPEKGWHLVIAGQGPLTEQVIRVTQEPRWQGKVEHRYPAPAETFNQWLAAAHVGLNCQLLSDPISNVTFPSKVFTYLSAGLLVISSRSGCVEPVCGKACFYYAEETPESLAAAMKTVLQNFSGVRQKLDLSAVCERYSPEAMAGRMKRLLNATGWE